MDVIRDPRNPVRQFFVNPRFRSTLRMRILNPKGIHQVSGRTQMNRYPAIFEAARDYFGASASIRILSFGCSTGEEVLTLREYFPAATIIGSEINRELLRICRGRAVDERIEFIGAAKEGIDRRAPFDAIFCNAVLQRDPQRVTRNRVTSLRKVYPFEKFDQQIAAFDSWLRPGGMLVVHKTHYLLADTGVSCRFRVLSLGEPLLDRYAKFDREGELIGLEVESPSIFLKVEP